MGLEQSQKGIKTSRDQEGLRSACHLATQEGEAGDMSEGERETEESTRLKTGKLDRLTMIRSQRVLKIKSRFVN